MSGVTRTSDLQTVKTRAITFQNADNTFPIVGSVLAAQDSRGHLVPTRSLSLDSITIANDTLTLDACGNIVANTLTLQNLASAPTALSVDGNVVINNANIVATGSGLNTGQIQGNVINVLDPTASNPNTYLYANSGSLLWQNLTTASTVNLSSAPTNLLVDPSGTNLVPPTDQTDFAGMYRCLTTLLNIFNDRQIFISYGDPSGGIPPVDYLPPYSSIFNSKCGVLIRVVDVSGNPVDGVGDFVFYGNANNGTTQYTLSNLCTSLTNLTNVEGNTLSEYVTFAYNAPATPLSVSVTPNSAVVNAGYYIAFLDIDRVGEAQRFMNHLGFYYNPYVHFGPPTGTELFYPVTSTNPAQYLPYIINGAIVGHQMTGDYKYPNNDVPLTSPTWDLSSNTATSMVIRITAHPDVTGLNPGNIQQLGNELRFYGVYINGTPVSLIQATPINATPPLNTPITINFPNLLLQAAFNTVTVTSIDCFNETVLPVPQRYLNV